MLVGMTAPRRRTWRRVIYVFASQPAWGLVRYSHGTGDGSDVFKVIHMTLGGWGIYFHTR